MASDHRVKITHSGFSGTFELNGRDMTTSVRAIDVRLRPAELPKVTIEPVVFELPQLDLDHAQIVVDDHTEQLLLELGWTPPKETDRG